MGSMNSGRSKSPDGSGARRGKVSRNSAEQRLRLGEATQQTARNLPVPRRGAVREEVDVDDAAALSARSHRSSAGPSW